MTDKILEIIKKRNEFLNLLDQDIAKNDNIFKQISQSLKEVETTCENVRELGQKPEHEGLIPLCKNLFIPGRIIHTGEYLVTTPAHPNSYSVLKTLDQTINCLEHQIKEQKKLLQKAEIAKSQLQERKKILYGDASEEGNENMKNLNINDFEKNNKPGSEDNLDSDDDFEDIERQLEIAEMPKKIYSEKGVALKVGGFFEILEYEES